MNIANQGTKRNPATRLPANHEDYLTKREVAHWLGCHINTVDNWRRAGKLKRGFLGGRCVFSKEQILRDVFQPIDAQLEGGDHAA